jgi:hypothetical protein
MLIVGRSLLAHSFLPGLSYIGNFNIEQVIAFIRVCHLDMYKNLSMRILVFYISRAVGNTGE